MSSASGGEGSESSHSWNEWQQQLQAYVAWVNSQLKKKPGTKLVKDLTSDMIDGTAFAHLISIVGGEEVAGIHLYPTTIIEMKENNDRIIHFMRSKRIRMHQTTSKDIVEGNFKVIMRLILALAAHYKPTSVKHTPTKRRNMVEMAQGAVTALAHAKQRASFTSVKPCKPRLPDGKFSGARLLGSGSDLSDQAKRSDREDDRASSEDSHYASTFASPPSSSTGSPQGYRRGSFPKSKSEQGLSGGGTESAIVVDAPTSSGSVISSDPAWQSLLEDHEHLGEDLASTRKVLLSLQNLLLTGQYEKLTKSDPDGLSSGDESDNCLHVEGSTSEERLDVMKSRLQLSEEHNRDLKAEILKMRGDIFELQGQKRGLQARLEHHEDAMLKMKAELLRVGFASQGLQNEKQELDDKLSDKQKEIDELRKELINRDRNLDELLASVQLEQHEKAATTRSLRSQIQELHERLRRVSEKEASLTNHVGQQDKQMTKLEARILQSVGHQRSGPSSILSNHSAESDELQLVRRSLQSLKTSFAGDDPSHRTIDTLEQSITSLMERLDLNSERFRNSHSLRIEDQPPLRRNYPISPSSSYPSVDDEMPCTKVLYFTDRTVTPYMCTIPKRLGEITLGDLRQALDKHGRCRFHFKALDPEFGTVKEELCNDEDIVPGWEGRIVAWLEEDHG